MWKAFVKLLLGIGKMVEDRELTNSTYTPQYRGQWVNKGKGYDEDWQWVEKVKSLRPYHVCVFQVENDYIITTGFKPRPNSIESVHCEDERSVELSIKYLKAYYSVLGNVFINTEVE